MSREPLVVGPFAGGLNLFDDPTAIRDFEVVEALNFDAGLDGSLKSRPPYQNLGKDLSLGATGNGRLLGVFYLTDGTFRILASDGLSSTWVFDPALGGSWTLVTNTFAASSMTQFDGKAWLTSPVGEADPGGYWAPVGGFVADANMPHGDVIVSYNFRLWVAPGKGQPGGTTVYYSKVLGQANFWLSSSSGLSTASIDIGAGDGQSIVALQTYYNSLIIFRTQSIFTIQYNSDPALSVISVLVPGVGLENKGCLVSVENFLYFMYDSNAYQFINNQVSQINVKVLFSAFQASTSAYPFTVSYFNRRVIFSYYDMQYVYSLRTKTWTRWNSTTYKSIGKIFSPVHPDLAFDQAYVFPSAVVPPPSITRRNRVLNPTFRTNITSWQVWRDAPSFFQTTTFPTRPHVGMWYGMHNTLTSAIATSLMLLGGSASVSASAELGSGAGPTKTARIGIAFFASDAVTQVGATQWSVTTTLPTNAVATISVLNVSAPATAVYCRLLAERDNTGDNIPITAIDNVIVEYAQNVGTYFDGATPDTSDFDYAWTGLADNSESTVATLNRKLPLLFIEDKIGNVVEFFTCELRTKNYNFETSSNFKHLFWWGVDSIFRGNILGQAIPIAFAANVTWGTLRLAPKTWGSMLGYTWGSPTSGSPVVDSDYNVQNLGSTRKFVKFNKGLRFRQIGFRVVFDVDGTVATLPVQIFTLSVHLTTKETVVKTIS